MYNDSKLSNVCSWIEGWGNATASSLVFSLESGKKLPLKDGNPKVALLLLAKDSEINMQLGFSDKWILLGH